ncbi:MAG: hypothetical protein JXB50_13435 [Spirochaetes bacterium]|nr:hypothetical protein [Spirochaetota bacterium]
MLYFEKGNINEFFDKNEYIKTPDILLKEFFDEINKNVEFIEKECFMEISRTFTNSFKNIINDFKEGAFLSDSAFDSLLSYHFCNLNNYNVKSYNFNFNAQRFESLKFIEKFDLVYSIFGLTFNNLYEMMGQIINFLKINGILAVLIPAYWYIKDNLLEIEKTILNYSKQNDKKWIFVEPLDLIVNENNAVIINNIELKNKILINRYELSIISGLEKLKDAVIKNNIAHLDVSNIPDNKLELRTSLLLIQKKSKTLTKDNLFKI